jgi:hypothetical protein
VCGVWRVGVGVGVVRVRVGLGTWDLGLGLQWVVQLARPTSNQKPKHKELSSLRAPENRSAPNAPPPPCAQSAVLSTSLARGAGQVQAGGGSSANQN